MVNEQDEEMVPLALAAQRLGITYNMARNRMLAHQLLGEKINGRWYVTVDSIDSYRRYQAMIRAASERLTERLAVLGEP